MPTPEDGMHPQLTVFLLARSLEVGGAERQLVALAKGLHARGHKVQVAAFYCRGPLLPELERAGVEVVDLRKRGRWDVLPFLWRTVRAIRSLRPQIVYSFVGANLITAALMPFTRRARTIWGVRASDVDLSKYDWLQQAVYAVERRLATVPHLIIANSHAGREYAIRNGFPATKTVVVPNGIDTHYFHPDPDLRRQWRERFALSDSDVAVGVLARVTVEKDYPTFVHAALMAHRKCPRMRFFCIGAGTDDAGLKSAAAAADLGQFVHFLGSADAKAALSMLDIFCSSSVTEGFSNSVAEALACGLPCVVTDAGDSALIVGRFGMVVPPRSPEELARALLVQCAQLDRFRPDLARRWVEEQFSVDAMVRRTEVAFKGLVRA